MNEITLLRDAGPKPTPLSPAVLRTARAALLEEIATTVTADTDTDTATVSDAPPEPASVLAARQLVEDARERRSATAVRRLRPSRPAILRIGAAALATVAAVTAAVLVTGLDGAAPPSSAPSSQVAQAGTIRLVDFTLPTLSLTLPTPPPGTGVPTFGASADGGTSTSYTSTESSLDFVSISVGTDPLPAGGPVSFPGSVPEDVTINGSPAVVVAPSPTSDEELAGLGWERQPGQWVTIQAQGRYAQRDLLMVIAASLVDSPQVMPVQLHLAPAGYSLDFFKDSGRIVHLGDDTDPSLGLTVRLLTAEEASIIQQQLPSVAGAQAQTDHDVTVQGQPAQLSRTDEGAGGKQGWVLLAQLPEGSSFVVEAPGSLTSEQVVQIADQVTYTP